MHTPRLADTHVRRPVELTIRRYRGDAIAERLPALADFVTSGSRTALSRHPSWLTVLAKQLCQEPFVLEAVRGERTVGFLGLMHVKSLLFGRFLVSLPYLNYGGVQAEDASVCQSLVDRAVELADELNVRYLELRHEWAQEHPALAHRRTDKVHMRLELPATAGKLWDQFNCKVRNQVRKGQKGGFGVHWGGIELLPEFYAVFSRNMRDLGTPVFSRGLFEGIIRQFPDRAEFCVVRDQAQPVAAAILLHGWGVTEVPSAGSLRACRGTSVNMLMYWNLLERSIERGQDLFDFGRSTENSSTFNFKKQWGAAGCPAEWQYYLRRGDIGEMRLENPKYKKMVGIWQRMPVWLTNRLGPRIVRGIP